MGGGEGEHYVRQACRIIPNGGCDERWWVRASPRGLISFGRFSADEFHRANVNKAIHKMSGYPVDNDLRSAVCRACYVLAII